MSFANGLGENVQERRERYTYSGENVSVGTSDGPAAAVRVRLSTS